MFNSKDSANFITLSGISLNFLFSPRWISYIFESSNKITLHEIEVLPQVKIGILEDKKVTVGNIATAIKNLGIEPKIAEQIIQTIDEKEVERHCGNKYNRGNGEQRYKRAGTSDREPVTAGGKLKIKLHKIKDKETNETFKPVKKVVELEGKKVYQEDISMIARVWGENSRIPY